MFNGRTLKEMETVDTLVSKRNKTLFGKKIFISWTFPTNHIHEQQSLSGNYFAIWVGETGKGKLEMVCFAGVWMLDKLLSETTDEQLLDIIKNPRTHERI